MMGAQRGERRAGGRTAPPPCRGLLFIWVFSAKESLVSSGCSGMEVG